MNRRCIVLLLAAACGRGEPSRDSTAQRGATAATGNDWVSELGPVLVIPGDTERVALVLNAPGFDTTVAFVRVGRAGLPLTASVPANVVESDTLQCEAPTLRLRGAVPADWTIGVASGAVSSVALDSLEALTGADSAALAADVARVASALAPPDSRLRGLPFVALKAYRLQQGDRSTLLATVLRRLPQEADPLEARAFVVAESKGRTPYTLSYGARSEGSEETVEHFALLGVLRVADKEFAIVEREQVNGTRYEILERSASGEWHLRWSRALNC